MNISLLIKECIFLFIFLFYAIQGFIRFIYNRYYILILHNLLIVNSCTYRNWIFLFLKCFLNCLNSLFKKLSGNIFQCNKELISTISYDDISSGNRKIRNKCLRCFFITASVNRCPFTSLIVLNHLCPALPQKG